MSELEKAIEVLKRYEVQKDCFLPTLAQARVKAGKTQKQCAEILGMSYVGYRSIEKGLYKMKDEYYNILKEVIGDFQR